MQDKAAMYGWHCLTSLRAPTGSNLSQWLVFAHRSCEHCARSDQTTESDVTV
jgi:hypothetical protein